MPDPTAEELKAAFLPRLRDKLDALRSASPQTAADRRPVELDQQSVGRLSRMDAMQQQAMAATQEARQHGRVRSLEAAIRRLEPGEFGCCDRYGGRSGLALNVRPDRCTILDTARQHRG